MFVLLAMAGLHRGVISTLPLDLHGTVNTNVNLFVTFVNLRGTNVVIGGSTALVSLKGVASNSTLLNVVNLLVASVLLIGGIHKTLLVKVLLAAIVNVPVKLARLSNILDAPPSVRPVFFRFR